MDFRVPPSNLFNPHCKDIQKKEQIDQKQSIFLHKSKLQTHPPILQSFILQSFTLLEDLI